MALGPAGARHDHGRPAVLRDRADGFHLLIAPATIDHVSALLTRAAAKVAALQDDGTSWRTFIGLQPWLVGADGSVQALELSAAGGEGEEARAAWSKMLSLETARRVAFIAPLIEDASEGAAVAEVTSSPAGLESIHIAGRAMIHPRVDRMIVDCGDSSFALAWDDVVKHAGGRLRELVTPDGDALDPAMWVLDGFPNADETARLLGNPRLPTWR